MKKVLIVDDEKIISTSLYRVLTRAGFSAQIANNGIEAIHILEKECAFDAIFLDLLMPEIGGGEVLDFAKKKIPSAKIFMMTAYGDILAKEDLLRRGANKVLAKPFDDITQIPHLLIKTLEDA